MNKIYVGLVVSTHGIKGEIRIISKLEQSLKEKVFKVGNSILINDKEYKVVKIFNNEKIENLSGYNMDELKNGVKEGYVCE